MTQAKLSFGEGRYLVQRELGRGGMGVVTACLDQELGRPVAIKTLAPEIAAAEGMREIFLQEGRALARLDHPSLVRVFDVREELQGDKRVAYLVMEYVEGETLERLIYQIFGLRRTPPGTAPPWQSLTRPQLLRLLAQVAQGLAYCHRRDIIHRDIKPANILIRPADEGPEAKLIDFGLARSMDALLQRMTMIRGTPAYMAPEQILGEKLVPATDIYALGATLFEVVCGRTPFVEGEVIYHQVNSPPPVPSSLLPGVPRPLDDLILRCLAKQPDARPQSGDEVAAALLRIAALEDGLAGVLPLPATGLYSSVTPGGRLTAPDGVGLNLPPVPVPVPVPIQGGASASPVLTGASLAGGAAPPSSLRNLWLVALPLLLLSGLVTWRLLMPSQPAHDARVAPLPLLPREDVARPAEPAPPRAPTVSAPRVTPERPVVERPVVEVPATPAPAPRPRSPRGTASLAAARDAATRAKPSESEQAPEVVPVPSAPVVAPPVPPPVVAPPVAPRPAVVVKPSPPPPPAPQSPAKEPPPVAPAKTPARPETPVLSF